MRFRSSGCNGTVVHTTTVDTPRPVRRMLLFTLRSPPRHLTAPCSQNPRLSAESPPPSSPPTSFVSVTSRTPGGVIAYISSSSSGSSPESCHSDSSNGSYQSSSPPRGSLPSHHKQGQPVDPALAAASGKKTPGPQKSSRSKCSITSKLPQL